MLYEVLDYVYTKGGVVAICLIAWLILTRSAYILKSCGEKKYISYTIALGFIETVLAIPLFLGGLIIKFVVLDGIPVIRDNFSDFGGLNVFVAIPFCLILIYLLSRISWFRKWPRVVWMHHMLFCFLVMYCHTIIFVLHGSSQQ